MHPYISTMHEVKRLPQHEDGLIKRWFQSTHLDLFIWLDADEKISAIELTYDKYGDEKGILWSKKYGFQHLRLCPEPEHHSLNTPVYCNQVLTHNFKRIRRLFKRESDNLESLYSSFVLEKLHEFELKIS